jgi:C4-dicarboxylate-specific signal transduction histidine kinase
LVGPGGESLGEVGELDPAVLEAHGIGLAIVQDILRAYRGELQIERSEELGGSRFKLSFTAV